MSSNLDPGTTFGSYRIEGFIAAGGMGQVYAARHAVYGTPVAMKVLHADLHADADWRRRFDIEGLVGTQLKHPHVLSARELVEHGGRVALVIDLVFGGQTLLKVVTREYATGVPLVAAMQVFLGILQGVEYAHTKGIVHGDLKPENVLLSGEFRDANKWVPLVTDFGTVALIAHPVTIDGQVAVVASPRYACPEHMYGVDHLEKRSDIYALGLLLHFLLTGRHVSDARTVQEAADRVVRPIPVTLLVDQPESVIALIQKACAVKPQDRYASCRELALAVRKVLDERGVKLVLEDLAAELATELIEERSQMKSPVSQDTGSSSEPTVPLETPMKDPEPAKNPLWGNKIDPTDEEDAPTARLRPDQVGKNLLGDAATPIPPARSSSMGGLETGPPAGKRTATPQDAPRAQPKPLKKTDVVTIPEFAPPPAPGAPDVAGAQRVTTSRPSQIDTAPSMDVPSIPGMAAEKATQATPAKPLSTRTPAPVKPSDEPTNPMARNSPLQAPEKVAGPGVAQTPSPVAIAAVVIGVLAVVFLVIVLVYTFKG